MQYEIRKSDKSDAAEILELQLIAFQSEAEIYNDYSIQPLIQTLEQVAAEYDSKIVLKAVVEGKIIGSVRAYEKGNTAYIGKLMVLPEYRNQGLGKLLLKAIEDSFQGRRFELFTGFKSKKNIALYEKSGYRIFKTETITPDMSEVYMEKPAVSIRGTSLRE